MTPREFFEIIAKPNIEEAKSNINELRTVFNACAAIEGLASHLHRFYFDNNLPGPKYSDENGTSIQIEMKDRNDGGFKRELSKIHEAFGIVHDIAEAQKHAHLHSANRKVISSAQVKTEPHGLDYTRWDELFWDEGNAICVRVAGEQRVVVALAILALDFLDLEILQAEAAYELRHPDPEAFFKS